MYIELTTYGSIGYSNLREGLVDAGFRDCGSGFEKKGRRPDDFTTVCVLEPQSQVAIYFGPMGIPVRVSRSNITSEALEALRLALGYVRLTKANDHTSNLVNIDDLVAEAERA